MAETRHQQFDATMTVEEALAFHPAAKWVFASYHLGGCSNCDSASDETLAEVAEGYGLPLQKLLNDLNSLLRS